jgi:hypothetical protein
MNEHRTNKFGDDLEYCVEPEKMTVEELIWTVKQLRESNHTLTDMIPIDYILEQAKQLIDTSS